MPLGTVMFQFLDLSSSRSQISHHFCTRILSLEWAVDHIWVSCTMLAMQAFKTGRIRLYVCESKERRPTGHASAALGNFTKEIGEPSNLAGAAEIGS
jgi:hypothetical protein